MRCLLLAKNTTKSCCALIMMGFWYQAKLYKNTMSFISSAVRGSNQISVSMITPKGYSKGGKE